MRNEDHVREALQREAAKHRVDPALRRSTIVKARVSRALAVAGGAAVVTGLVFGGAGVVGAVRDDRPGIAPGSGGGSSSEASEPATAYGAPLLLVTEDGWRVTRIDQYDAEGEMTFTKGEQGLDLFWRNPESVEMYVEDRANGAEQSWDVTIAGSDAKLFRYEGTDDYTALWPAGKHLLELRGIFPSMEAYMQVAASLEWIDEQTWMAALPEDTVTPDERAAVVDEMLRDISHHRDGRLIRVREASEISDRYQLGAEVTGAVACYWIETWLKGKAEDDERGIAIAEGAMGGARSWPILEEMKDQGGWSQAVWEYADAMTGDGKITGGRSLTIEESYRDALGCR